LRIALAEAKAGTGDPDRATAALDEAPATADRTGYRAFEAELHRVRGDILLNRDPADPVPAEDAYQTAIAIAKQQGARSFGSSATLERTAREAKAALGLRDAEGPKAPSLAEYLASRSKGAGR
jgi:hypothetical protein